MGFLIPVVAKLYINWVEIAGEGRTIYHMHRVRGYLLEDEDHMVGLRRNGPEDLDRKLWVTGSNGNDFVEDLGGRLSRHLKMWRTTLRKKR